MSKNIKIIAEVGWNHMGDIDLAKKMILEAKRSGADICKFQTWREENLKPGPWDNDGRREIYKKANLSKIQIKELYDYCIKHEIEFCTSIFNPLDFELIDDLNFDIIKIPSHEMHNHELIEIACKKFKTVLVSFGACSWNEILLCKEKFPNIIPMHCVSSYPCKEDIVNFPKLEKIKSLGVKFGYSGHYSGTEDAFVAISRGASFIEKHFTLDNDLPGRDNKFALLPMQFEEISKFVRLYEMMNIDRGLEPQQSEMDIIKLYRGRWSKN
jgi:N,N'-diacetyllegionaminate synthase